MAAWAASRRAALTRARPKRSLCEAASCATSTVRRFDLRSCTARDADADALAGIFQQLIAPDGSQLDALEPWLQNDNPREPPRNDVADEVRFYGHSKRIEGGCYSGLGRRHS